MSSIKQFKGGEVLFSRFALCPSKSVQGMLILRQYKHASISLTSSEPSTMQIAFKQSRKAMHKWLKFPRPVLPLHRRFQLKHEYIICLTVRPLCETYWKMLNNEEEIRVISKWAFTKESIKTLSALPILGFNRRFDNYVGLIK